MASDILRSDNGPQYSSLEFLQFRSSWGVRPVTSSPHYVQSNGEAERAVQTAKNIIRKSTKSKKEGLLAHRATPGPEGYSPAELLMGRKLKTNVPTLPGTLEPKWEYQHQFRQHNAVIREREAKHYNRRHKTRDRPPLQPGTVVQIIHGSQQQGSIVEVSNAPRSYVANDQRKRPSHKSTSARGARSCYTKPSRNGLVRRSQPHHPQRPSH
ncbi:uncharacterized protein K02A2.6-like [Dermacentor silvarum]|uniref:uncharacterized protein K02A2.6-like n=1 Tax=Dermacentor silvarum TaxID=543639 RepID=UPI001896D22A|nr:uncharacterized protein K02A2.6-like [Dermacentor silvarum]